MPIISGFDRNQISFSSLEDAIAADNEVRFIDAFDNKLDLRQLSFLAPSEIIGIFEK